MDLVRKGAHGGRSRDSFWGEEGELPFPMCLRDEAIDGCRVKAAFNACANRLFEFCRAAVGFTWCLFHVFDRHRATRVGCNYLFYWLYGRSCLEGDFEPLSCNVLILKTLRSGAEGGTRTPTSYLTRPSNVRVYQFRHFGSFGKVFKNRESWNPRATMARVGLLLCRCRCSRR